ncbi:MAG: glycoside hydrolase family 13 protein [Herbinix sp.]|nr:glycoside hydrolase family 13 protein [Herbinix sp.]
MIRESILHIPMSNYAHGLDETHVLFRIRTARKDIRTCTLYYGDRACRLTPVIFSSIKMNIVAGDLYFDYFEVELESPYTRICYYFELDDGIDKIYYYSELFTKHLTSDRSAYYQLPYNRREDIADVPKWVKDAIIYNIFPDSFATSRQYISALETIKEFNGHTTKGKNGGTILGILENIDYLMHMGISCVYINPIFAAGEYHKYDILDYYHIDPCFGTNEEFHELVQVCHSKGIRVIIDGVFNHCGWKFFAFEDVVINGENSQYKDWFYRLSYPVIRPDNMDDIPNYECFGYERLMPKLNTSNPEVIRYFCDVCRYWLEEYDIDGWRLDVANEVNDDFWRAFRKTAKKIKPDCFLIGEVWESAEHYLKGDLFDSTMNYDFRKSCQAFFAEGRIDAYEFDSRVTRMRMRYRRNMLYGQLNLLDSHDVSRFLSLCQGSIPRYKLAVIFQMMFIGAPSIFYGDEQQIMGLTEDEYRSPMVWNRSSELFTFYQLVISLRKELEAIRYGSYCTIYAGKGDGLYIFERVYNSEKIAVILNGQDKDIDINGYTQINEVLLQEGYQHTTLSGYGYIIANRKI